MTMKTNFCSFSCKLIQNKPRDEIVQLAQNRNRS